MRRPWTGVGTALVTPFTRAGELDEICTDALLNSCCIPLVGTPTVLIARPQGMVSDMPRISSQTSAPPPKSSMAASGVKALESGSETLSTGPSPELTLTGLT